MNATEKETNWIKRDEQALLPGVVESPNVLTESQDSPGQIRVFRGTTSLTYPIDLIAKAISEPEARLNWVERMAEDILIEGKPEDGEWLSYEAYELIWPVSDRDYVFRQTMDSSVHEGKKITVVNVVSIEHPDYPERPKRVRGFLPTCTFTLHEVNEHMTDIVVVVQVDPGGSLPEFLKNMIQKGWALKTLRALNNYLS